MNVPNLWVIDRSIGSVDCYLTRAGKEKARITFKLEEPDRMKNIFVMFDSNYQEKIPVPARDRARGVNTIETAAIEHGLHKISLLGELKDGSYVQSNEREKQIEPASWTEGSKSVDGKNQRGINGNIEPHKNHDQQMIMEGVDWQVSNRDLKLKLKMANVTNVWNTTYGYDHVYLSVFFAFPGNAGKDDLPKIDYRHKDFRFNVGALLYGAGTYLYQAEGSSQASYGQKIAAPVEQVADVIDGTIEIYFPRRLFKDLKTLSGVKVLITTWDGDSGELRNIEEKPGDWVFGLKEGSAPTDISTIPKVYNWVEFTL